MQILNKILITLFILGCGVAIADNHIERKMETITRICSSHDFVSNDLIKNHNEQRRWYAVSNKNEIIELYVDEEDGSWTIITTGTNKLACGLAGGNSGSVFIE